MDSNTEDAQDIDTGYHESVTAFRRELMKAYVYHFSLADAAMKFEYPSEDDPPPWLNQARVSGLMAASYGYTLAAVLKIAEDQFGPDVARTLAFEADNILTNGDFDDYNGDLKQVEEQTA